MYNGHSKLYDIYSQGNDYPPGYVPKQPEPEPKPTVETDLCILLGDNELEIILDTLPKNDVDSIKLIFSKID